MRNKPLCMIVLTALIVIGCQENSLENSLSGDGRMIRYSVVSDMVSVTKAFDELAVPSSVLSDKSGAVAIPLSLEVSQGITYASAVSRGKLVNTTDEDKPLSSFESIAGSFVVKAYSGEVEKVSQTVTWSALLRDTVARTLPQGPCPCAAFRKSDPKSGLPSQRDLWQAPQPAREDQLPFRSRTDGH